MPALNNEPVGALRISDGSPAVGQVLTVGTPFVSDADNAGDGSITPPVAYFWQADLGGNGVFTDITVFAAGELSRVEGASFTVTADVRSERMEIALSPILGFSC